MSESVTKPEFYSIDEVAEILDINKKTVERWIESGELPSARFGKRVIRIPAWAITDRIKEQA